MSPAFTSAVFAIFNPGVANFFLAVVHSHAALEGDSDRMGPEGAEGRGDVKIRCQRRAEETRKASPSQENLRNNERCAKDNKYEIRKMREIMERSAPRGGSARDDEKRAGYGERQ